MPRHRSSAPRKLPRQRRAVVTFEAVLEAAERVLEREGLARLTTGRVADVAGVSVGSLYQYFPNKDAIVSALNDRYLGRQFALFVEAFTAAPPSASLEEEAAAFLRAVVGSHRNERKILAALYHKLPVTVYQRTLSAYLPYLVQVLERHAGEVRVARLDVAALLVLHAGDGLMRALFLDPPPAPDAELLALEFVRMVAGYARGLGA